MKIRELIKELLEFNIDYEVEMCDLLRSDEPYRIIADTDKYPIIAEYVNKPIVRIMIR